MKVQTKILLLLLLIVTTLVGGLGLFAWSEQSKYQRIARERAAERDRAFSEFLQERGDNLRVLVDDRSIWDDLVRAVVKSDRPWMEGNLGEMDLALYSANSVWVYRPDGSLFYSHNNRFADNLRELPLPPEALGRLFEKERTCYFFMKVPQGWMEIRGATIHPSRDRDRLTRPQGMIFAGHIWIDDRVRRMAQFTGYEIRIQPIGEVIQKSAEELGRIRFARPVPGWDGASVAEIRVEHDSPLIREFNTAGRRLFWWLIGFAAVLFFSLFWLLGRWVRRPLRLVAGALASESPARLELLEHAPNEWGKLAGLILRYRTTEERLQRAEDELRHAQKLEAVGRLAGGVAHDFNNLLTAILGYSEMLLRHLPAHSPALEHARLIYKAGEQAAGLTKQLLAFSRKQILQPRVLDLNDLVREMEKLLQRVIGEHIRIELRIEAKHARVLADPNQIEQVILNLGVNARDAMPGGGTLRIATLDRTVDAEAARLRGDDIEPGLYVSLLVSDSGSGMSAETRERIFEPFFTTKGPGKGTGLGLATVYGIVKQSRGSILVESELGHGSTFIMDLPVTEAALDVTDSTAPEAAQVSHGETVLVAEDEEVVRMLVCAVLEECGYTVICAARPSEAIRMAQEHRGPIHLLVTDVVMPEMHGPALAKLLLAVRPGLRVLYISGYSENDISDQGVLDAGLDLLQKPFTHEQLVRKVRGLLDGLRGG